MPNKDLLYQCFEKILDSFSGEGDSEMLVARVVETYMMELVRQAHIPIRYLESLREDLVAEVHEMLKIKTYGHVSLNEYLSKKSRHS